MISPQTAVVDKLTESFREKILRKCGESVEMKERFFSRYAESLEAMSRALAARFQKGARLFAMGNGGSLCDALHITVEFNHPIIEKRAAFPVIPLMADTATMTAIGNALEAARKLPMLTVAFAGKDGGRFPEVADYCFIVPSYSIHRIQEVHATVVHVVWDLVHIALGAEDVT